LSLIIVLFNYYDIAQVAPVPRGVAVPQVDIAGGVVVPSNGLMRPQTAVTPVAYYETPMVNVQSVQLQGLPFVYARPPEYVQHQQPLMEDHIEEVYLFFFFFFFTSTDYQITQYT
jgi:hypothetical protein